MKLSLAIVLPLMLTGLALSAHAQHTWHANPTTGHWYAKTQAPTSWTSAQGEATAANGYLTVIEDAAENAWIHQTFVANGDALSGPLGPWIGLFQDTASPLYAEPLGGWTWVASTSTYFNWMAGEPNDAFGAGGEEHAHIFDATADTWNDAPDGLTGGLWGIIETDSNPNLQLQVSNLVGGSQALLQVTGAVPGEIIGYAYSLVGPGPTPVPSLPGLSVELSAPFFILGGSIADASGLATLTSPPIPTVAVGLNVWFDAVSLTSPFASAPGVAQVIQ